MKHQLEWLRQPYGRGEYALHRGGRGIYWEARDGVVVRLAAPEQGREAHLESRPGEARPPEGLNDWRGVTAG